MPSIDIVISNKLGLHARAAAKLTQVAGRFKSEVYIARGNQRVNAKSIMGVMMLAAGLGITVTVDAEGPDENEALEAIQLLFENKFGEPE
ncbi:HPr family phosphocarrier protein [Achromobacter sp. F4_2707]|uniref:HPr family phosphocarrier protein n=1 Tax=Achromobacter sp. F4_2707 TaxID=3114286 RepID=UPI0039C60659